MATPSLLKESATESVRTDWERRRTRLDERQRTLTVLAALELAWLISRSCDIAEQLDTESRRQVRHRMLASPLEDELLRDLQERCPVTIEIADPETRFELSIYPVETT
ncbi:hypothetical protein ACWFR5_23055 [Streptomyces sp. NPDC055092]